ncbi:ribonuclease PH [Engelhardtia mirabilis]|uniref:Ribonuclease PH n=1 Tax=Engelhardtia mirabilis TaxID=2528011 RepID=A0A518BFI5_9BACT|nr:Ribonuclease PH [Planctomycetes bacterium Pla133]QDV00058.1 Ribonuclease PH [Planctomycetes bacterium Pla86]
MPRSFDRSPGDMRPIEFQRHFVRNAPGSVLVSFGHTKVLCTAIWTDGVPNFLQGKGQGWMTAEYAMLPASTNTRKQRDRAGRVDGRSVEIQRLIGRSLRAVIDLKKMTERTIWIDCDVIQADGGTRTASITGAWLALHDCLTAMQAKRLLREWPLRCQLAAVSVGVVGGEVLCDLDYSEDSQADVDMNLVITSEQEFVEVQGAAEGRTFTHSQLKQMLDAGDVGAQQIFAAQREALEG